MNGAELREWRKRNGYSQDELMKELGIRSRQTISSWENSNDELSRMLELALNALEYVPESRRRFGSKMSAMERKQALQRFGDGPA